MGTMTAGDSGWKQLLAALATAGKYVTLDLSACAMTGTEFNTGFNLDDIPDNMDTTGKDKITGIVLPTAATSIGENAFVYFFTSLKSVTGANVTAIGEDAFGGCTSLTSISFPVAVTIGSSAFSYCTSLTSINFPKVTTINDFAFSSCTGLTSVSFPAVQTIGSYAFSDCTSLTSVSFPSTVNFTGNSTYYNSFSGCTALTLFTLTGSGGTLSVLEGGKALVKDGDHLVAYPSASGVIAMTGITSIGFSAFGGCTGLISFSSSSVQRIGNGAFYYCTGLTSFSSSSVQRIGVSVFQECTGLSTLNIPGVTNIGPQAFLGTGATNLTITMGATPPSLGNDLFNFVEAPKTVTVNVPSASQASYDDPWKSNFKGGNVNINLSITTR